MFPIIFCTSMLNKNMKINTTSSLLGAFHQISRRHKLTMLGFQINLILRLSKLSIMFGYVVI
jgi:hypothetical protein